MGTSAAGWISIGLFIIAWVTNAKLGDRSFAPYLVMPVAIGGSIMMYASVWSETWANGIKSFMLNVSGGMPVEFIFGAAAIVSLAVVVADLWLDPRYNLAAICVLVLMPTASHGSSGIIGNIMNALYRAFALGTLDAIKELFGG